MKTLAKYHDAAFATIVNGALEIVYGQGASRGWELLDPSGLMYSETYFDLAGLSQQEKTLFFDAIAVQESGLPAIAGDAGDNYVLYDYMTTIPIDITNLSLIGNLAIRGLGFPGSELNYEHVLYARTRRLVLDLDTSARMAFVAEDHQSGSIMPTASDRIYCYRIVVVDGPTMSNPNASSINVQAARYVLSVEARDEAEYQHLMRLKRSYDLQQSYDNDQT